MRTPFFSFPAFVSSRCASLVSAETATSGMCSREPAGGARPARELYLPACARRQAMPDAMYGTTVRLSTHM